MRQRATTSSAAGKKCHPSHRQPRLRAESLEPRRMLAGNVAVSASHGTLFITGDNANNFVEVFGTGTPGQFVVEGILDNHGVNTTINRSTSPQTFNGVTNISVAMNKGDDFFGFEEGNLAGNLSIDMGDGCDEVAIGTSDMVTMSVAAPIVVPAQLPIGGLLVTIGGTLCVNLGSGNNRLVENFTDVKQSETINGCDGNDSVQIGTDAVLGVAAVAATPTLASHVVVEKNLTINLGGGTNDLDLYDLLVEGCLRVDGSGANHVEAAVINVLKDAVFNLCGKCNQDFSIAPETIWGTVPGLQNHIGGNLVVNTGCGDDRVVETSLTVGGSNSIKTDGGCDTVILGDPASGLGDDADALMVGKDLCVNLGCGNDSLHTNRAFATGACSIVQGLGNATIAVTNGSAAALKITTDGGRDNVTLTGFSANTAQIYLGAGNDTLTVSNTTIITSTFDGGRGVNTYTDGGGNLLTNLTKRNFS